MIQESNKKLSPKLHIYSNQFLNYSSILIQSLKIFHKQTQIQNIYLTQRCYQIIVNSRITINQFYGCGFKKIYHKNSLSPYLNLNKIIVVANITQKCFEELNEVGYLFPEIYLLTLQTTSSQFSKIIKNADFRQSIKFIKQVNLNFFSYLDGAHYISKKEKSYFFKTEEQRKQPCKQQKLSINQKVAAYLSFLTSYPKLYEYELHYIKTGNNSYNKFVQQMESKLTEILKIMDSHSQQCKQFDRVSSPKIKCLIINRSVINDLLSPLIYGYYYGPLCQQFINRQKLIEGADFMSSKGKMFNHLFDKNYDESSEYILKLTEDKKALEGPFEANYFFKAKHMIASFEDPSPIELSLHISCYKETKEQGISRIEVAALQQDIVNRVDEFENLQSNRTCLKRIEQWILDTVQGQNNRLTEDQLIKLCMITEITGDLWYFHQRSLKKLINDPDLKRAYQNFIVRRKQTIQTHKLLEKIQPEDRSQLYRHEPKIISICHKWLKSVTGLDKNKNIENVNQSPIEFDKKCLNNDILKNRDSKFVILVDGIIGYNELALLRRMARQITTKQVSIIVESFCNTQQYSDYLTRPISQNNHDKNE